MRINIHQQTENLLFRELNKGYQELPSNPWMNGSITCPAGGFSIRNVGSLSTRSSTPWIQWGSMSYKRTEHKSITNLPGMLRRMRHTRFVHEIAIYPSKVFMKPGRQTPGVGRPFYRAWKLCLKVVCFRSTSRAVFKEAMKKVRSWPY